MQIAGARRRRVGEWDEVRRLAGLSRKSGGAVAKIVRGSDANNADLYTRMADAVISEFARPTDAMIDAAYEAVRFDEAWAINSRRDFVKALEAMVRVAISATKQ